MSSKAKSIVHSASGVLSDQVLGFITAVILGRILDPEDFGLVALLLLVNGFLSLFASAAISSVIIQYRDFGTREIRAFVGLCWSIGLVLALLSLLGSSSVGAFFSSPKLVDVIRVGALGLLLTPISQIVDGVFVRDNRFGMRACLNVSSAFVAGSTGISMAFLGFGYWALVAQIIVRPLVATVLGFSMIRLLPVPLWDVKLYRRISGFVFNLVGFRALYYWTQNLDNLMIGNRLKIADLGMYTRAYALYNLSSTLIQAVFGPLLHTSLASVKDDAKRFKKEVLEAVDLIACLSVPVMGVASVYSSEIVYTTWGMQWSDAVLPFSLLALAGMLQPLSAIPGAVMKASGKTRALIYWAVFKLVLYVCAISIGLKFGILGVALGITVIECIFWMSFVNYGLIRSLNIGVNEFAKYYLNAGKLFLVMICVAYLLRDYVLHDLSEVARMVASLPVFALSYIYTNYALKTNFYQLVLKPYLVFR